MHIRPINPNDSIAVANLHSLYLPTEFSGKPGMQLLQLYYKAIAHGFGATGFVAENSGDILGFVCGVWDQKALNRSLIRNYSIPLLFWAFGQVLLKPSLLTSLFHRVGKSKSSGDTKGYELRPIVTSLNARGSGLAVKLVDQLFKDAVQRGYTKIHLITELDNIAAQKLYLKVGFQEVGVISRRSTSYLQLERSLST